MAQDIWEDVDGARSESQRRPVTERMKVPGGWVIRSTITRGSEDGGVCTHQIFIEDPGHTWIPEAK